MNTSVPSSSAAPPTHNQPEYSVSQISRALKQSVEQQFGFVRVRGEISGLKRAASGHVYLTLKDENATLNTVCWKGIASRLPFAPEDGIEVICTGRLTTYAQRSNYQLVVERMEPAGVGALMALLEQRKKALAGEGLFDAERKQPLPFLPEVIGVVTSPTGAVIRDILHRLSDRFPRHVLVWPVLVQGQGAAEQVAAAIRGYNALPPDGQIPRPDVLIVARGGGSLEDLWGFNEEVVVRAAAASRIPLISAVGHETDTTLIDYASDRRAPTPSAAAEMAVPVRAELLLGVEECGHRTKRGLLRMVDAREQALTGCARGLGDPLRRIEQHAQRLDDWEERLRRSLTGLVRHRWQAVQALGRLPHPHDRLMGKQQKLEACFAQLHAATRASYRDRLYRLREISGHLRPEPLLNAVMRREERQDEWWRRIHMAYARRLERHEESLASMAGLLGNMHYRKVLARGFALVRTQEGAVISDASTMTAGQEVSVELACGAFDAAVTRLRPDS